MSDERRPRVMCVDDDAVTLRLISRLLEAGGYEVTTAESGEKALETLATLRPDIILLDVMMVGITGYEVCSRIVRHPDLAEVPVIFMTTLDGQQDRAKAFAAGGVDYLVKPTNREVLLETMQKHLKTRSRWNTVIRKRKAPLAEFGTFKEHLMTLKGMPLTERTRFERVPPSKMYTLAEPLGLTPSRMAQLAAEFVQLPFTPVIETDKLELGVLPPTACRELMVIPIRESDGTQGFILSNPFDGNLIAEIRRLSLGVSPRMIVADPAAIEAVFAAGGGFPEPQTRLALTDEANRRVGSLYQANATLDDIKRELHELYRPDQKGGSVPEAAAEPSPPVVMLVDRILDDAVNMGASDIHIEPAQDVVLVRYRVDGELRDIHDLIPGRLIQPIIARLKIMSHLDITERRMPQDGRIVFRESIDLRLATAPMNYGEKAVLRVLDKRKAALPLDRLGFSKRHLAVYREKIQAPYGLILHVGPTGSGKSMTLFSALREIANPSINVQTIEDPIEYTLPRINQMQTHAEIGLTFARGLRSFLRQDPDVILVGEIRDLETAEVAVEAALTGHLLLSTLHTNDAASTVLRLFEMGIQPFMVSASLVLVCAQRLLRRLCTECRVTYTAGDDRLRLVGLTGGNRTLHRAGGCKACGGTGYRGRIGVHELLVIDEEMRLAMTRGSATTEVLKRMAIEKGGMTTLYWDAMEKVREGVTSFEEVIAQVRGEDYDSRPDWMLAAAGEKRIAASPL
ncbi:MAG: Flp pilus assembly complex ATPase component TadA [Planctomycetes bacterium]|nr:Flp pilus assembly complex ATPase component TadA [Planctomycetota bacterium]